MIPPIMTDEERAAAIAYKTEHGVSIYEARNQVMSARERQRQERMVQALERIADNTGAIVIALENIETHMRNR
jgi:hypothetical protein